MDETQVAEAGRSKGTLTPGEHAPRRAGRMESRWYRVGDWRLHARVSQEPVPEGAPEVVLVHGLVVASRYMEPLAQMLAPYCRVYVPELPGFGRSDKPPRVLSLAELADALAGWMDAAGLERAALLGNSFGCQTVVEFAVRHPERLERAVLQGPTTSPGTRSLGQQLLRWGLNSVREPAGMGRFIRGDYRAAGLRRAARTFRMQREDPVERKLPHVRAPTLVVRGSRDAVVTQPWVEEMVRLLPHGRLVVVPGAVHTLNYYRPLELLRVVRPFLGLGSGPVHESAASEPEVTARREPQGSSDSISPS